MSDYRGTGMLAAAVAPTWLSAPGLARAGDIVISDGTFDSWKFASYLACTGNPAATMKVDTGDGSPAPAQENITFAGAGGTAGGYGYDAGAPINADLSGAKFVLTVQVNSGAGDNGVGQDIHLLVFQQGEAFISYWHRPTGESRGKWKTLTIHGRFGEGFFTALQVGASAPYFKNPAITTYFGLYSQNAETGEMVKDFYDNYTLTITPKQQPTFARAFYQPSYTLHHLDTTP